MAVDTERRAKKTAHRLDHSILLQPVTTAMASDPSDQSPDGEAPVTDDSSLRSVGDHIHSKSSINGHESPVQSQQAASKRRRPSKPKVPSELRRSSSTPHMRNLALGNSGELSPTSNKPRNKLGYHRTSVACGHCRRRKIRCLLASEDPQGRCANCIRLKKECNFYPVEHAAEGQGPQATPSKDSTPGQPLTPALSSPRRLPSVAGEAMGDLRPPYQNPPSASQGSTYGYSGGTELDTVSSSTSNMPVQQTPYPYPHPIDTQWPPTAGFLPSSTVAESPSSSVGYWRQSPSTANSVYGSESNVSGGHTPAAMSTSSTMSFSHPDGHTWGGQPPFQPPTRSMSYGNIEGLPSHYQSPGHGLGIQHDYPRRTPSYPYPTSIDTNHGIIHATTLGSTTSAPLSAPIIPNHQVYPPAWNQFEGMQHQAPPMPIPGRSMSGQWYTEPSLDRVQEEGGPPVSYNAHGLPQYYSGT